MMTHRQYREMRARRERLVAEIADIDGSLRAAAVAYAAEPLTRVPCGGFIGTVQDWRDDGVDFSHDCTEHGYDLNTTEGWLLPVEYLTAPDVWRRQAENLAEKHRRGREAYTEHAERREYERLRAKFGGR